MCACAHLWRKKKHKTKQRAPWLMCWNYVTSSSTEASPGRIVCSQFSIWKHNIWRNQRWAQTVPVWPPPMGSLHLSHRLKSNQQAALRGANLACLLLLWAYFPFPCSLRAGFYVVQNQDEGIPPTPSRQGLLLFLIQGFQSKDLPLSFMEL